MHKFQSTMQSPLKNPFYQPHNVFPNLKWPTVSMTKYLYMHFPITQWFLSNFDMWIWGYNVKIQGGFHMIDYIRIHIKSQNVFAIS